MTFELSDVFNIEGDAKSEADYYASLQRAINSLEAWKFQGSMGRAMMAAIEDGHCMLARSDCRDFYGNHIPSRAQVQEGTVGSRGFVVERMGEEWAAIMEAL